MVRAARSLDIVIGSADLIHGRGDSPQVDGTPASQCDATSDAFNEVNFQMLFERMNLQRNGSGGDIEFLRSACHAAEPAHCFERTYRA